MSSGNTKLSDEIKRLILREDLVSFEKLNPKLSPASILFAAKKNKVKFVRYFIDSGINVNASDALGFTPLHYAIQNENVGMTSLLIKMGADINKQTKSGKTPLHLATLCKKHSIYKKLFKRTVKLNVADSSRDTPLHVAARNNRSDVIQSILDRDRVGIDLRNHSNETPLAVAINHNSLESVKVLISHQARTTQIDNNGYNALMLASMLRSTLILTFLVETCPPLMHALYGKSLAFPLHFACEEGNTNAIDVLLSYGTNIDVRDNDGRTPLFCAMLKRQYSVVDMLLKRGANMFLYDEKNNGIIDYICYSINLLRILLDNGFPINSKDLNSRTLLHHLCDSSEYSMDFLNAILAENPDVDVQDNKGETPLMLAAKRRHHLFVKSLVERTRNIDVKNNSGLAALDIALYFQRDAIVKLLIESGSNFDCTNTPAAVSLPRPEDDCLEVIADYY